MKTWIALIVVLVSGIIMGIIGTLFYLKSTATEVMEGDFQRVTNFIAARLENKLELTPQQVDKVKTILRTGKNELLILREKFRPYVEEVIDRGVEKVKLILNKEQKKRLEEVVRWMKRVRRELRKNLQPTKKKLALL